MKKIFLLSLFLYLSPVHSFSDSDQKKILDLVQRIDKQSQDLNEQVHLLKNLLGQPTSLNLEPKKASSDMSERARIRTEDGLKSYEEENYESAKDSFHLAWENAPSSSISHFNLGLAYHKLGNTPLAKKMLKSAVELDPEMEHGKKIKQFVMGSFGKEESNSLSLVDTKLKTQVTNLMKRAESYMKSQELSPPERTKLVVRTLDEVIELSQIHPFLVQEFYMPIIDMFTSFEMYERALKTLKSYEKSMVGEVLPDDFHIVKLRIQEKEKKQSESLREYWSLQRKVKPSEKLSRDLHELEIFSAQMQEFVSTAQSGDTDFDKICQRLGEYRWGNRSKRHVIVVNRYQELLYSSLSGTLPLGRYRDSKGREFLKDITLFPSNQVQKQAGYFPVDLNVNGEIIPYMILYAYVPKHDSFIIVRLPEKDLS